MFIYFFVLFFVENSRSKIKIYIVARNRKEIKERKQQSVVINLLFYFTSLIFERDSKYIKVKN